jgi:hypothetical protein
MTSFNCEKMEGFGGLTCTPTTGRTPVEQDHDVRLGDGVIVDADAFDQEMFRRAIVEEVGLTNPLTALGFLRGELDIEDIGAANSVANLRALSMMSTPVR